MNKKKLHKALRWCIVETPNNEKELRELHEILHNLGYKWLSGDSLLELYYGVHEDYQLGYDGFNHVIRNRYSEEDTISHLELYTKISKLAQKGK